MPSPAIKGALVGQKLGKYELLALIAVGGTAEIYLARISSTSGFEKYLVVKCLLDHLADDPEFVRMFLDEARISAQLDHSNIVQTLELAEHEGRYFLVMEYLAGMSVAQMARKTQERGIRGGLLDPNIVFGMAAQTCGGLHYAHAKTLHGKPLNLVHRDISPQNLVVSFEGIVKIVDFGIAKSDMREVQTRAGMIKGKYAYMSPEQCLAKQVDHRTDIFALGILCHELLTGQRLFKRQSTYDTYQAIVSGGVPTPSSLNPTLDAEVDKVIMKALSYEREDRYDNAQAFGEALLELLHHRGGSGGSGEISRFFDEYFGDEIEAHLTQMRELVTGHRAAIAEGSWDSELSDRRELSGQSPGKRATTPPPEFTKPARVMPLTKAPTPLPASPDTSSPHPSSSSYPSSGSAAPAVRSELAAIATIPPKAPDAGLEAQGDDELPTRIALRSSERITADHKSTTPNLESEWTDPNKRRDPADNVGSTRPASSEDGEISVDEFIDLPAIPTAAPPERCEDGNDDSSAAFKTLEGPFGSPSPLASPQTRPAQFQQSTPPGQARRPMPLSATLTGQQPVFQKSSNAKQQSAPTQGILQPTAPLAYPQTQNNTYSQPDPYQTGPLSSLSDEQSQDDLYLEGQGSPALWMHLAIFAVFVGLGLGVAAFIKVLL